MFSIFSFFHVVCWLLWSLSIFCTMVDSCPFIITLAMQITSFWDFDVICSFLLTYKLKLSILRHAALLHILKIEYSPQFMLPLGSRLGVTKLGHQKHSNQEFNARNLQIPSQKYSTLDKQHHNVLKVLNFHWVSPC